MKFLSFSKLKLYSLYLLTLSFGALINPISATETKSHSSHNSTLAQFREVQAIQASELRIGKWTIDFTAAVNETDPILQAALVQQLLHNLAPEFSITIVTDPTTNPPTQLLATDFASLLQLVVNLSSQINFGSIFTGNFANVCYEVAGCGQRYVSLDALSLAFTDLVSQPAVAATTFDHFELVETHKNCFKISSLVSTVTQVIDIEDEV